MHHEVPELFLDLTRIATYIYCADQAVKRGDVNEDVFGDEWRRSLFFRIPVHDPDFWNSQRVNNLLCTTLGFLSEDQYQFDFLPLTEVPAGDQYFGMPEKDDLQDAPDEVVLFSGGLDSLAGAVQEAVIDKHNIVLVNHRTTSKMQRRYRKLLESLGRKCKQKGVSDIQVIANNVRTPAKEYTQRTRSFLYSALAGTIAQMFGLSRIRFYENGVVSLNLPILGQVVGSRATRTTHPKVLGGFSEILSAVAGKRFDVENPFLWKTKTDVLKVIASANCADMIEHTSSCTHTREQSKEHSHCGKCSQCIDRRVAVLAAGLEQFDPKDSYRVDLLGGERENDKSRLMLTGYFGTALDITRMSESGFFSRFGETCRALGHIGESEKIAAQKIIELHQKHGQFVKKVLMDAIAAHRESFLDGSLPPTCLLRWACSSAPWEKAIQPVSVSRARALDADNYFIKKGRAWEVSFAGKEPFILLPSKGAAYLHILLSNPGRGVDVEDIYRQVSKAPADYLLYVDTKEPGSDDDSATSRLTEKRLSEDSIDAGVGPDTEAFAEYVQRRADLRSDLDKATNNNDIERESKIAEEINRFIGHSHVPYFGHAWRHNCTRQLRSVPVEQREAFLICLYFTVLVDQAMHCHFRDCYTAFEELTKYPKFCHGLGQFHLDPRGILSAPIEAGRLNGDRLRRLLPDGMTLFVKETDSFLKTHMPHITTDEFFGKLLHDPDVQIPLLVVILDTAMKEDVGYQAYDALKTAAETFLSDKADTHS